jgi:hypothetical protein
VGRQGPERSHPVSPDERGREVERIRRSERHRQRLAGATQHGRSEQNEIDGLEPLGVTARNSRLRRGSVDRSGYR